MIKLTIKNNPVQITNISPAIGQELVFSATDEKMNIVNLKDLPDKFKIISSVPSIETSTCYAQTVRFNKEITNLKDFLIITISKDLPFSQKHFCEKNKINNNFYLWSDYRNDNNSFSNQTNLIIVETQLLARSVMILDKNNKIRYLQIVKEVSDEPNYEEILTFIKNKLK